jgi:anti-sigma factor RsiW
MNDSEAKNLLPDYLEGNLSDESRAQIEECLAASEGCRVELAYLKRVQTLIAARPRVASPDLWSGIHARIDREESDNVLGQFEWLGKRLVPLLAAAAVVVFTIFGNTDTTDAELTLEDYLRTEWEGSEVVMLTNADISQDEVLYLMYSR